MLRGTVLSALGAALLSRRVPQSLLGSVHGQAGRPGPVQHRQLYSDQSMAWLSSPSIVGLLTCSLHEKLSPSLWPVTFMLQNSPNSF